MLNWRKLLAKSLKQVELAGGINSKIAHKFQEFLKEKVEDIDIVLPTIEEQLSTALEEKVVSALLRKQRAVETTLDFFPEAVRKLLSPIENLVREGKLTSTDAWDIIDTAIKEVTDVVSALIARQWEKLPQHLVSFVDIFRNLGDKVVFPQELQQKVNSLSQLLEQLRNASPEEQEKLKGQVLDTINEIKQEVETAMQRTEEKVREETQKAQEGIELQAGEMGWEGEEVY